MDTSCFTLVLIMLALLIEKLILLIWDMAGLSAAAGATPAPFCNESQHLHRSLVRHRWIKTTKATSWLWLFSLSLPVFICDILLICVICLFLDGQQSPCSSVTTSAKALSLNLKSHYSQTPDQLITSTPAWPLQTSSLSPNQVDCAESYLNLLNLENSTKPAASVNGDLDPFIRANGVTDNKESSGNEVIPFTSRNSTSMDEK